ncbi:MAG: hypothetical protein ACFCUE_14145 [Candidatus Bathyarchaeia archaeon]|jgi:hypothetical protein
MIQAKNVAQGFIVTASAIGIFETVAANFLPNLWLALLLSIVLVVPLVVNLWMAWRHFRIKKPMQAKVKQTKNVLMALQGFGFACWFFDVLSTTLVIDVKHASSELNPLGWPLSALGALAYFVPISFVAYYLLFRLKSKESFYAAVVLTGVSVFMGLRNFGASIYNLSGVGTFAGYPEDWAVLSIWLAVVTILATLNAISIVKNRKMQENT